MSEGNWNNLIPVYHNKAVSKFLTIRTSSSNYLHNDDNVSASPVYFTILFRWQCPPIVCGIQWSVSTAVYRFTCSFKSILCLAAASFKKQSQCGTTVTNNIKDVWCHILWHFRSAVMQCMWLSVEIGNSIIFVQSGIRKEEGKYGRLSDIQLSEGNE